MYISLHLLSLIYILVIVIIIFQIRKFFFRTKNPKYFFIPDNPTYNNLYLEELRKIPKLNQKIKYLGILPKSENFICKKNLFRIISNSPYSDIIPKTFLIDSKTVLKPDEYYIIKKNIHNKLGIKIIQGKEISDNQDFDLGQEIIYNLGRQYVIRVYVLGIQDDNSISVFCYSKNKLLFCSEYLNNKPNFRNIVTNSSYIINSNEKEMYNHINDDEFIRVLEGVKYIIQNECNSKEMLGIRKFQLFGIDIKADKLGKYYLLEINKNPNMSNFHSEKEKREKEMIIEMYNLVQNKKSEHLNFKPL